MNDLPKQYAHAEPERHWYPFWLGANPSGKSYFHSEPDPTGEKFPKGPYTIVIPPPNVTGALHLGHALNNTLQDTLVRWKRMQGFNALWMPGTDHAGIATQAVVERRLLQEEKLSRHDLGREKLVERIWAWKNDYEQRILGQLQRLGCSCDWQRTRFTLDDQCARAVRETFFNLFKEGRIYRGKRLVNWDTFLQTAVSDDEVFHETVKGHFWHIKYPVVDPKPGEPEFVTVATTRPETMLGDTAVAVHPDPAKALDRAEAELRAKLADTSEKETPAVQSQLDALVERRGAKLAELIKLRDMARAGRMVRLPLADRDIPLVADEWAKPEMGSGAVKITPAHDPNDYDVGRRQNLRSINIMSPDGTLNGGVPEPYQKLSMARARERVVADLETAGLLAEVEDREIDLAHSDRSKTPIEPWLADQWFVKMNELAQSAMDAVSDGRVKIFPSRYAKTYLDWLGEKRDWPVSRQLWWGHRIPVWTRPKWDGENYTEAAVRAYFLKYVIGPACGDDDARADEAMEGFACSYAEGHLHICFRDPSLLDAIRDTLITMGYTEDPDVLDTWFSSALWPHSTLGWPDQTPELAYYYPTSTLVTSRDIITLWVARMVLMGLHNVRRNPLPPGEGGEHSEPGEGEAATAHQASKAQSATAHKPLHPHPAFGHLLPEGEGVIPFHEVFIHPKILDGYGDTMSKSKGNGVDPIDVIEKFGADALRFGLTDLTTETQDVRMPVEFECPHCGKLIEQTRKNRVLPRVACTHCSKEFSTQWAEKPADKALPRGAVVSERFEKGRNFCNKLWNAARFALMNLEGYTAGAVKDAELAVEDRWILSRLATVAGEATGALDTYRFADYTRLLYEFAWDEFCSFYVEMVKGRLQDAASRQVAQRVLAHVLDNLLRLLHPVIPFITEEIWRLLNEACPARGLAKPQAADESVVIAAWPEPDVRRQDVEIEARFARFQEVLKGLREIRARQNIPPKTPIKFSVRCDAALVELLRPMAGYFESMAGATATGWGPSTAPPATSANITAGAAELFVDLVGLIDVDAEIARKEKDRENLAKQIQAKEGKLANENFVSRAPADVVAKERASLDDLRRQLVGAEEAIAALKKQQK
ncbi:MAG TPA: valine--tRNA ligase [Pirellulales bacterium]|jgi:valyl-tRNA synthetase|nr:valine--tRNA ligase [Pirellulales bacterium]